MVLRGSNRHQLPFPHHAELDVLVRYMPDSGLCYLELLAIVFIDFQGVIDDDVLDLLDKLLYPYVIWVLRLCFFFGQIWPFTHSWRWAQRSWPLSRSCLSPSRYVWQLMLWALTWLFISCVRLEAAMLKVLICLKEKWEICKICCMYQGSRLFSFYSLLKNVFSNTWPSLDSLMHLDLL